MHEIMRDKKTDSRILQTYGLQKKLRGKTLLARQPGLKMSPKADDPKRIRNFLTQVDRFHNDAALFTESNDGRRYCNSLFPLVDQLYRHGDKAGDERFASVLRTILADHGWLFPEARCVSEEKRSDEYRLEGGLQFQNESDISVGEDESDTKSRLLDELCDVMNVTSLDKIPVVGGVRAEDYLHYALSVVENVPFNRMVYWRSWYQEVRKQFPTLSPVGEPARFHPDVVRILFALLGVVSKRKKMVLQDQWIFETEVTEADHQKMKDSQTTARELGDFWRSDRLLSYSSPDLRSRLIKSIAESVPQRQEVNTSIPIQLDWQTEVINNYLPRKQEFKSAYRKFYGDDDLGIEVEDEESVTEGSDEKQAVKERIAYPERLEKVKNIIEKNGDQLANLFCQYYKDSSVKDIDRFKTVFAYSTYHYERAAEDDIEIAFGKYDLAPIITFQMFINCRKALRNKTEKAINLEEMFQAVRIETEEEMSAVIIVPEAIRIPNYVVIPAIAVPVLFLLLLFSLFVMPRKRKSFTDEEILESIKRDNIE